MRTDGISVVILTWNSEEYIEECISSLYSDADGSNLEIEIIVVDNGSRQNTIKKLDELKRKFPFEIIKLKKNYGSTRSRNLGIKKSKGRYIALFDSDTSIKKGALKELLETIERYEKVGLVAPRLVYPDGNVQSSCKRFPTIKTKILKLSPLKFAKRLGTEDELYDHIIYTKNFIEIIEADYCISAAWMVSRKAIEDVGVFDENIFYSPEDVDYCLRMWKKGWRVLYNPNAVVIHHAQRISYKNWAFALSHMKGLLYFFKKHGYWFSRKKLYDGLKNVSQT